VLFCYFFSTLGFTREGLDESSAATFSKPQIYLGIDRLVFFVHDFRTRNLAGKGSINSLLLHSPILRLFQEGISCCWVPYHP
jgi:hypothetical protein